MNNLEQPRYGMPVLAANTDHHEPVPLELKTGQRVELRAITAADRDDLLTGFEGLSSKSRYFRFFSVLPRLPSYLVNSLLDTNGSTHVAIGARRVGNCGLIEPPIVGVARFHRADDDATVAEAAIAVVDELHGLGLGKLLLRNLVSSAIQRGITHFHLYTLARNVRLAKLLLSFNGTIIKREGGDIVYEVELKHEESNSPPFDSPTLAA